MFDSKKYIEGCLERVRFAGVDDKKVATEFILKMMESRGVVITPQAVADNRKSEKHELISLDGLSQVAVTDAEAFAAVRFFDTEEKGKGTRLVFNNDSSNDFSIVSSLSDGSMLRYVDSSKTLVYYNSESMDFFKSAGSFDAINPDDTYPISVESNDLNAKLDAVDQVVDIMTEKRNALSEDRSR